MTIPQWDTQAVENIKHTLETVIYPPTSRQCQGINKQTYNYKRHD